MKYDCICDIGCVRTNNEDMAYVAGRLVRDGEWSDVSDPICAFAVADGMGGYEGGEIASEIVARSFAVFMRTFHPADDNEAITGLKSWALQANRMVIDTAAIRTELAEMGTTFTGIVFLREKAWMINVGDSRCYRIRDGILKQLSIDHSERARTGNPEVPSNLIYNFMGNSPEEFISDITELKPTAGDTYILCSDGLSDLIGDDTIEANYSDAAHLVELAKDAGGRDNITIIAIQL